MKESDLKLLMNGSYPIGVLSFIFALITYYYEERIFGIFGMIVIGYPYRDYTVPLVFVGILFIALGVLISQHSSEKIQQLLPTVLRSDTKETSYREIHKKSFCKYCGAKLDSDAVFCEACGKRLS